MLVFALLPPLASLVMGCTPGDPPARLAAPRRDETLELIGRLGAGTSEPLSAAARAAVRRPGPQAPPLAPVHMDQLGSSLTGGVFDESLGQDLVAAISSHPDEEVEAYGAGVLSLTELHGPALDGVDGLCEDPHVLFEFAEDGEDWELDLRLFGFLQLMEPLQTLFMSLSETCESGVDAAGGDVSVAQADKSCSEQEVLRFFPEEGECRSCVSAGQTVESCLAVGSCDDELPLLEQKALTWFEWAETEVLACAPDVTAVLQMAAWDLPDDGSLPETWDHTSWAWLCFLIRSEDTGEIVRTCAYDADGTTEVGDGVGDGAITRIGYLRNPGDEGLWHADRVGYNRSIALADGRRTDQFLLSFGGTGQISTPVWYVDDNGDGVIDEQDWTGWYGGWGFNPRLLRPDGTDPEQIDHTFARDWLASVALKMSTTRDGVPINVINHSRCVDWAGPHEDGTYTCVEVGDQGLYWFEDIHVLWANSSGTRRYAEPMMTLGSTGLPDPTVPGGLTPLVAGTPALAKPGWDDCAWRHSFLPDHIRTEDEYADWGGVASLDAHTYKFGKDPALDLRVVMATSQARGFCPEWQ